MNNNETEKQETGKTPEQKQAEEQERKAEIAVKIERMLDRYYEREEESERRLEDTEEEEGGRI